VASQVIDLGLDREAPSLDRPEPVRVRHRRAAGAGVVVAMALVLAAGSAPAAAPLPEVRIAAGFGDEVALSADRLYLIPSGTTWTIGPRVISAYELPAGRRLWHEPLPVEGQVRQVIPAPGSLLVVVERDTAIETVAIDASSGRVRWSLAYQPIGLMPDGGLLLGFAPAAGPDPPAEQVAAVELSTGRPVWTYQVPDGAWHGVAWSAERWAADGAGGVPRSVTAWPSGRVAVRDLATGQVVAEADLPGPQSGNRWFQLAGDLLLAAVIADGLDVVTAYGLPGLDRRWTVSLGLAGGYVSTDCGGALCFFNRTGGLRVVDPATGATRWSDPRWQTIETVGGRLLGYAWPSPQWRTTAAVLDPATGGELLDLGRWTTIEPVESGGRTRAVRIDPASGRAWFAVVDVDALTVRVIASAGGISGDCRAGEHVVVCRRLDASVGVWRFP
jgi:outer membrane protein assembly factor BamB